MTPGTMSCVADVEWKTRQASGLASERQEKAKQVLEVGSLGTALRRGYLNLSSHLVRSLCFFFSFTVIGAHFKQRDRAVYQGRAGLTNL